MRHQQYNVTVTHGDGAQAYFVTRRHESEPDTEAVRADIEARESLPGVSAVVTDVTVSLGPSSVHPFRPVKQGYISLDSEQ